MTGPVLAADVVEVRLGDDLPPAESPRPHLHPVRSLAGVVLSDSAPTDHPHHHGVGVAVADLGGTNHWGGRTFVRGRGSVLRDDHGRQRVTARRDHPDGVDLEIVWTDERGRRQGVEARRLRTCPHPAGWVLSWRTAFVPDRPLSVGSSATNGRPGAFYGGWFWRTPFPGAVVATTAGTGVEHAHGVRSPWLLVTSDGPEAVSLLAVQRGRPRPWFVRTQGYVGFGPALAVAERLVLTPADPLVEEVDVLVLDERLEAAAAAGLAAGLLGDPGQGRTGEPVRDHEEDQEMGTVTGTVTGTVAGGAGVTGVRS
ncbi:DUF6807 family protein [Kineococcus sp. TBRC 1896]|uniref:DUF6807 family protein n=1 Tax=Kineococcus mangrovi TaxID=1660183 RepID=A0ABV4I1V8_9ACTN